MFVSTRSNALESLDGGAGLITLCDGGASTSLFFLSYSLRLRAREQGNSVGVCDGVVCFLQLQCFGVQLRSANGIRMAPVVSSLDMS